MSRAGRYIARRATEALGNAGSSIQCRMPICRRGEHRMLFSQH